MKTSTIAFCIVALIVLAGWSSRPDRLPIVDEDTTLYDVYRALDQPERADIMVRPEIDASVALGERLVLEGISAGGGQQSAHFKCTSCHNVVREDPVLTALDPQSRLDYAVENGLPFLPGTTLWGAVNRETYYNDDYDKKYGDLVKPAHKNLREAIQLCATECAQGEALSAVEMESVLKYLHTIGLRLSDLPNAELTTINAAIEDGSEGARAQVVADLKTQYALNSPAHFVLPPEDRKAGYAEVTTRDPENGRRIYELGCLHCHENQRYSFFELDETERDRKFLTKHFPQYTRYSTYQVSRYGTSPIPGKRAYMPHYTAERISDQQLEDLRAYLSE